MIPITLTLYCRIQRIIMFKYLIPGFIGLSLAITVAGQPARSYGFGYTTSHDSVIVNLLIEDGPAAKGGIKFGDQLISINSKPLKGLTLSQVAAILSPTEEATLVISRNNVSSRVTMAKAAAYSFDRTCISGDCVNGKGKAMLKWRPDFIFEGSFNDGILSGEGKIYSSKGDLLYEGEIKNMAANGRGKMYSYQLINQQPKRFLAQDGFFAENILTEGKYFFDEKTEWGAGKWKNGKLSNGYFHTTYGGAGGYIFSDSISYDEKGQAKLEGPVTVRKQTPTGEILSQGNYKNGKRDGPFQESDWKGEYTHAVNFVNGKLADSSGKVTRRKDGKVVGRKVQYLKNGTVDNLVWNIETGYFSFDASKEYYLGAKGKRSLMSTLEEEYESRKIAAVRGAGLFMPQSVFKSVPVKIYPDETVANVDDNIEVIRAPSWPAGKPDCFNSYVNKPGDTISYKWIADNQLFKVEQKLNGLHFSPTDCSVPQNPIWRVYCEMDIVQQNENAYSGIYVTTKVPGDAYEKIILFMSNYKTKTFWLGIYDPVTKVYTSLNEKTGYIDNVVMHKDVTRGKNSTTYNLIKSNNLIMIDLFAGAALRFSYEQTPELKAFDHVTGMGFVTLNPQKINVRGIYLFRFSSYVKIQSEGEYYQYRDDELKRQIAENEKKWADRGGQLSPVKKTNAGPTKEEIEASKAYAKVHAEVERLITDLMPDANKWYGLPPGHRLFNMRLGNAVESKASFIKSKIRNFISSRAFDNLDYASRKHFEHDLKLVEAMKWDYIDYVPDEDEDW